MTASENRLLSFIAARLDAMLRRPAVWGSNLSVEEQVLQLLELRAFLLDSTAKPDDTRRLVQRYLRFLHSALPKATPQPLALQLEQSGREVEFTTILRDFVQKELASDQKEPLINIMTSTVGTERTATDFIRDFPVRKVA